MALHWMVKHSLVQKKNNKLLRFSKEDRNMGTLIKIVMPT